MSIYMFAASPSQDRNGAGNFAPIKGLTKAGSGDLTFSWTKRDGVTGFYFRLDDYNSAVNPVKVGWTDQPSWVYTQANQQRYGQPTVGTLRFSVAEYNPKLNLFGPLATLDGNAAFNNVAPYRLTARLTTDNNMLLEWQAGSTLPFIDSLYLVKIYKSDLTTVLSSTTVTDGPWYVYTQAQNMTDNEGAVVEALYFSVQQVDAQGDPLSAPSPIWSGAVPVIASAPPAENPPA